MAFQGIKNQGTDPLQLFLAIRQLRQQEEQTKQDQALARVKAMQEAQKFAQQTEKHRADMANAELTRLKSLSDIESGLAPQVDAAGVQTVTNIGDILQQTGAGLTGEEADAVFDVSEASAFGPVNTRAARAAMAAGVPTEEIIGGAVSQGSADRVERSRAIGDEVAKEERDAERTDRFAKRREDRAAKRAVELERRNEERRLESEQRAREQGFWEQSDLIAERNSISKQLAEPTRLLNEGWNALEKFEEDGTAQQYLEIVQRWVRKVDEGATVREGDIALVQNFGASAWTNFTTFLNGITDAEGKVAPESKEAIKNAFEQILTESDRGMVEEWEDRIAYADEQNWTDRERSKAVPRITAVRRTYNRFASRRYGSVELPGAVTEEEKRIAERRLRRRLNVGRNSLKADEIVLELKRMALERSERGGF